jgi:hypothetical protein
MNGNDGNGNGNGWNGNGHVTPFTSDPTANKMNVYSE